MFINCMFLKKLEQVSRFEIALLVKQFVRESHAFDVRCTFERMSVAARSSWEATLVRGVREARSLSATVEKTKMFGRVE